MEKRREFIRGIDDTRSAKVTHLAATSSSDDGDVPHCTDSGDDFDFFCVLLRFWLKARFTHFHFYEFILGHVTLHRILVVKVKARSRHASTLKQKNLF